MWGTVAAPAHALPEAQCGPVRPCKGAGTSTPKLPRSPVPSGLADDQRRPISRKHFGFPARPHDHEHRHPFSDT